MRPEPGRDSVLRCLRLALAAAVTFQLFYLGAQPFAPGLIPAPRESLAHLALLATLWWIATAGLMPALIATRDRHRRVR